MLSSTFYKGTGLPVSPPWPGCPHDTLSHPVPWLHRYPEGLPRPPQKVLAPERLPLHFQSYPADVREHLEHLQA